MPAPTLVAMRAYLRLESILSVWQYEDNKDLYIGAARTLRKRENRVEDDEDLEEASVTWEAKMLAYKDAVDRNPGEKRQRAGDVDPNEKAPHKAFKK